MYPATAPGATKMRQIAGNNASTMPDVSITTFLLSVSEVNGQDDDRKR
ncbi:MAG: hypothetical protein AAB726_03270 [Patescibacteria group bacterium]